MIRADSRLYSYIIHAQKDQVYDLSRFSSFDLHYIHRNILQMPFKKTLDQAFLVSPTILQTAVCTVCVHSCMSPCVRVVCVCMYTCVHACVYERESVCVCVCMCVSLYLLCFTFLVILRSFVLLFSVGDEVVSSVGRGLCVLIGISRYDTPKEMEYM